MNNLNLGSIKIPVSSATKTFAVLAKKGAGKTYTGCVMAEEFFKAGVPFVVLDPIDVWWGLRFAKNGMDKGLPIVVFGLDHADVPIDRKMGKQIAEAIVKENVSCIISTFGMPKVGQRELMADLAEELLRINDRPRHVFIEEAHEFVPQRVFGAMGKVFAAIEALVVMGRNRGLGVTLINQRAATINKDVLTQIDTLLAFRNTAPQDRKALKEWVEYHAAEDDFNEFMQSLPSLPTGEGWLWSPEFLKTFERIRIRERETFHPDREKIDMKFGMPRLGQAGRLYKDMDIQAFIDDFISNVTGSDDGPVPVSTPQRTEKGYSQKQVDEQLKSLENDYEEQLRARDKEIGRLSKKLEKIAAIIGDEEFEEIQNGVEVIPNSQIEMWASKLRGSAPDILRLLANTYPMKHTRSQIALAVGMSAKGGSFNEYINTMKRNNLIKTESGMIFINPDLL